MDKLTQEQSANVIVNFANSLPANNYLRTTYFSSLPADHPIQVLIRDGKLGS
jgi:hypothetical protein